MKSNSTESWTIRAYLRKDTDDQELLRLLKCERERTGASFAEIIRRALRSYLARDA